MKELLADMQIFVQIVKNTVVEAQRSINFANSGYDNKKSYTASGYVWMRCGFNYPYIS